MSLPKTVHDVVTPCCLVDLNKTKRNCESMLKRCKEYGVNLRAMTKTHKSIEGGVLQTGGTKRGLACSTLSEAEFYADNGFEDILSTGLVTADKLPRLHSLRSRLSSFHVMVDSDYGVDILEKSPPEGNKWSAFLMIDTGGEKAGVLHTDPKVVDLGKRLHDSSVIEFQGLYSHDGNSYNYQGDAELKQCANRASDGLIYAQNKLVSAGVTVRTVGLGSTPTCSVPGDQMKLLNEFHPGCYIFYDIQQTALGSCTEDDISIRVATRVIGHYPQRNQLLVDAGFCATSHDGLQKMPNGGSHCTIVGEPGLRMLKVNQEVGFIEAVEGKLQYDKYPIGSLLFLYPYHACAMACEYREYYVHEGEDIVGVWKTCCGW